MTIVLDGIETTVTRKSPGDGCRQLKDGRWEARFVHPLVPGKKHRGSAYGKTKGEALEGRKNKIRALDDIAKGIAKVVVADSTCRTITELGEKWILITTGHEGQVLSGSFKQWRQIIVRKWICGDKVFAAMKLVDVRPKHIEEALARMETAGASTNTRRRVVKNLRGMLALALRDELVTGNAAAAVVMPAETTKRRLTPSAARFRKLLDAAAATEGAFQAARMTAFIWAGLGMGLRRGEALGLTWGEVMSTDAIVISQHLVRNTKEFGGVCLVDGAKTKEGSYREAFANENVRAAFDALRAATIIHHNETVLKGWTWNGPANPMADDALVFTGLEGGHWDPADASKKFKATILAAGLAKSTDYHSLRHDFATWLAITGCPIAIASELLGHGSAAMTTYYTHISRIAKSKAISKLTLEAIA